MMSDWQANKTISANRLASFNQRRSAKQSNEDTGIELKSEKDFETNFDVLLGNLDADTNDNSLKQLSSLIRALFNRKSKVGISKTIIESKLKSNASVICKCLISSLGHSTTSRIQSLKVIIALTHIPYMNHEFQLSNINLYLTRLVDNHLKPEISNKIEFCLLIEYIRLINSLFSSQMTDMHAHMLLKILKYNNQQLDMICLETLLEVAYARPVLAAKCGCITELLRFILVKLPDDLIIENTMLVVFKVLNIEQCRQLGLVNNLFNGFLAPFVDTANYVPQQDKHDDADPQAKLNRILNACKQVLNVTFSHFVGFLCFKTNGLNIKSLLLSFRICNQKAINYLLDVFNKIFSVHTYDMPPDWTDFTKQSDIVNSEFHCFLSLKRYHKSNDAYKTYLLNYLIDNGIFEALMHALERLKVFNDKALFDNCLNLTARLWMLAHENNLMDHCSNAIVQPVLSIENDLTLDLSSLILDHLNEDLRHTDNLKFSFFFQKFLKINSNFKVEQERWIGAAAAAVSVDSPFALPIDLFNNKKEWKKYETSLNDQMEMTNILSAYSYSGTKLDCVCTWNWLEIVKLFKNYFINNTQFISIISSTHAAVSNLKDRLKKVLVNLVDFYTDMEMTSSASSQTSNYNREIGNFVINVGYYLIDFLIDLHDSDKSQTFDYLLRLYLNNVKSFLFSEINSNYTIDNDKCHMRDDDDDKLHFYLICLYIGHLSCTEKGDRLLNSFNIYELLLKLIENYKNINLLKYLLSVLSYANSPMSKVFLYKCLKLPNTSIKFKLYLMKLIRNIINMHNSFGDFELLRHLTSLVLNPSSIINQYALSLINDCLSLNRELIDIFPASNFVPLNILKNANDFHSSQHYHQLQLVNSKQMDGMYRQLLMNRLLSNRKLFHSMNQVLYMSVHINQWLCDNMNYHFYKFAEKYLFLKHTYLNDSLITSENIFNYVEDPITSFDDDDYDEDSTNADQNGLNLYRRSNHSFTFNHSKNRTIYDFVRKHLYSVLFQHDSTTIENILSNNSSLRTDINHHLQNIFESTKNCDNQNPTNADHVNNEDFIQHDRLKLSLWCLAALLNPIHISNVENIFNFEFSLQDCYNSIVKMRDCHPVFSIRSTAFYCIDFINSQKN